MPDAPKKPRHETFALLSDDDLLLAMDAVRRELRTPSPATGSLFDMRCTPTQLINQLACMQEELNYRLYLKEHAHG